MSDRLAVGVVGAGRVGAALGSALRAAGHQVVGASGTSAATLERIDTMLPGVPVLAVEEVVRRADLVLLTVPDDDLPQLVQGLATLGIWRAGQIAMHTAGRYGVAVLRPASQLGVIPLALHPAMTFTGTSLDVARLTDCLFAVTAPAPVLPIGQALVVEMGGEPVVVAEEHRLLYHAACAHGANHVVVLLAQALEALRAAGVENPAALLGPLVRASVDNALRDDPIASLTGPVVRGDVATVSAHLDVLAAAGVNPDVLATYRQLAASATRRAEAGGRIRADQARHILAEVVPEAVSEDDDADL